MHKEFTQLFDPTSAVKQRLPYLKSLKPSGSDQIAAQDYLFPKTVENQISPKGGFP